MIALSLFSLNVLAESKVCFKNEVSIYCESELVAYKSLNGFFYFRGQYFEFSARRSFPDGWCESTLQKILMIMRSAEYCMKFDEQLEDKELTLNSIKGGGQSWSYFQ